MSPAEAKGKLELAGKQRRHGPTIPVGHCSKVIVKDAVGNACCQSGLRDAKRPVERAARLSKNLQALPIWPDVATADHIKMRILWQVKGGPDSR